MRNTSSGIPGFFNVPEYTPPFTKEELDDFLQNSNLTEFHHLRKKVGSLNHEHMKQKLELSLTYSYPKPLLKNKIEEYKKKLDKLDQFDKKRVQLLEKKNTLETILYEKKDWLENSDERKLVSSFEINKN